MFSNNCSFKTENFSNLFLRRSNGVTRKITTKLQSTGFRLIDNDIIFVAIKDWVEVWALDTWTIKLNKLKINAGDIAEQILSNKY